MRKTYVRCMYSFCTPYIHALLVILLVSGLLAPRMSAVLAQVIPGVQVLVICTGDQMVTLTIGADGKPIEMDNAELHPCITTAANKHVTLADPYWSLLGRDYAFGFAVRESTKPAQPPLSRISPSRAPPTVV